jgi:hypothetical protein
MFAGILLVVVADHIGASLSRKKMNDRQESEEAGGKR